MTGTTTTPHDALDQYVRTALAALTASTTAPDRTDDRQRWWHRFEDMAGSRHLDLEARRMRERGEGFYTIGSAGHEANALVAEALEPTDPALLHYRSGAFYLARSRAAGRPLEAGLRDVLLGLAASADEPASGGRHKVFGHPELAVVPQTSTIASHLPRAVGVAFAIDRATRLGLDARWPRGAVAVASFGDASLNHSTAAGALNTASWLAHAGLPLPLLFVCEDNGLGISVPTPTGWVAQAGRRPAIAWFAADGDDPRGAATAAREAVEHVRSRRRPAFLHLRTVRYLGHAGTDLETAYRRRSDLDADLGRDPLLAVARVLAAHGVGADELLARYDAIAERVADLAREAVTRPRLRTRAQVTAPLAPLHPDAVATTASTPPASRPRRAPEDAGPLSLAQTVTATLADALDTHPQMLVFGEDVGRKGGVYGLTRGLQARFGAGRVFDSVLDEQSILGLGLGTGLSGLLPVPEIQYLAYLHNAEDQLRGEAASQRFFSAGGYRNPMVVRVAGLGYQKGFGGHFHNDNALAVLRDIPGLLVAVPAHPADAAPLLRTCLGAALADGAVSVVVEPIALYHERDLHTAGDGGWTAPYAPPSRWADVHVEVGRARTHGDGGDLTIVTFGNGLRMSLRVAARLAADGGTARVVDLRWLSPLPVDDVLREAAATGRVLVVDETRHAGGVGEGVVTALVEGGFDGRIARVASADSFVPLADAANLVLLQEDEIERAARDLLAR